jgi:hypothetical protein
MRVSLGRVDVPGDLISGRDATVTGDGRPDRALTEEGQGRAARTLAASFPGASAVPPCSEIQA